MAELVMRNFWWPGVTREVKQYVEGCDTYQCNKNQCYKLHLAITPQILAQFPQF